MSTDQQDAEPIEPGTLVKCTLSGRPGVLQRYEDDGIAVLRVNDRIEVQYVRPNETLPLDPLIRRPFVIEGDWNTPVHLAHLCYQVPAKPRPAA